MQHNIQIFQANSYWAIIGSKERRAALAEHCIRAKSSSWETTPDASTRLALSLTGRHCVQAWKHRQCFWGGEHWLLPLLIHQLSLPLNNPCMVSCGLPEDMFSHGWHTDETFASLASDQTPPREERQRLSGSIDLSIDWFLSLAWAEQDPFFLRELAVQGPEAAACVKCPWECLGRLWSHYSQCFVQHQEQCYWFSSVLLSSSWVKNLFF